MSEATAGKVVILVTAPIAQSIVSGLVAGAQALVYHPGQSMNRLGNGLWRVALALLLVVASSMMFTSAPRQSLVQPLAGETCSAPVAQDIPFLSRQQSAEDPGNANAKKWSEPPPRLTWDRRTLGELQLLATCVADTCWPPSAPRNHATARGPPA